MPSSDPPSAPKESLTAWQRWEAGSFGSTVRPGARPQPRASKAPERPNPQPAAQPAVRFPTAQEVEQIHQEAHKAGYAAGYEEGTARVRLEAMRFHSMVENIDRAFAELDQQVATELLGLSIEIARQVVRQALDVKPEVILEVVREALIQLPHQHASLYLHPEDASLVRSYIGDQLGHAGHRIFEDPQIARGGCRVEAAGSHIDATLETRWRRVLESIGRGDAWLTTLPK